MMPETKFSLKKIGGACKCFKKRKEPRVRGGEKGSMGKGRKKGI